MLHYCYVFMVFVDDKNVNALNFLIVWCSYAYVKLVCSILLQNGRGDVAIKKAQKKWHHPKEILNLANVQTITE